MPSIFISFWNIRFFVQILKSAKIEPELHLVDVESLSPNDPVNEVLTIIKTYRRSNK